MRRGGFLLYCTPHAVAVRLESALAAVEELEEHGAEGVFSSALLLELDRLDGGEAHLLGTGAVHLLADDLLDVVLDAPAEGRQE